MKGFSFRFCGCVLSMPLVAWLLPGIWADAPETAWIAGMFLGFLYAIVRPITRLLLIPMNCLSVGLLGIVVDALFVRLAASWLPGFHVDGFLWALAAAVITSIVRETMAKMGGA